MRNLTEHIREAARTPYNNVEPLFQRDGSETLRFGGSCVQQQRKLVENLTTDGHDGIYQLVSEGNAHTVSVAGGNHLYLLDTAFRMAEPLDLHEVLPGNPQIVPAYPLTGDVRAFIEVKKMGEILHETLFVMDSRNGNEKHTQRTELFQFTPAPMPSLERDIETARNDGFLRIVAVVDNNDVLNFKSGLDGKTTIQKISGPRLHKGKPGFQELYECLAGASGVKALDEYLEEGRNKLSALLEVVHTS